VIEGAEKIRCIICHNTGATLKCQQCETSIYHFYCFVMNSKYSKINKEKIQFICRDHHKKSKGVEGRIEPQKKIKGN
jgi:hypothetical protein